MGEDLGDAEQEQLVETKQGRIMTFEEIQTLVRHAEQLARQIGFSTNLLVQGELLRDLTETDRQLTDLVEKRTGIGFTDVPDVFRMYGEIISFHEQISDLVSGQPNLVNRR